MIYSSSGRRFREQDDLAAGPDTEGFDTLLSLRILLENMDVKVEKEEEEDLVDTVREGTLIDCHVQLNKLGILSQSNATVKHDLCLLLKRWPAEVTASLRRCATIDDSQWLASLKEFTSYRFRWEFCKRMFPEVADEEDSSEKHFFTIDRCNIFDDSFTELSEATPSLLHAGVSPMFRHEVAIGDGVVSEWANLLAGELFDEERFLFITSVDDMRRYRPCSQSAEDLRFFHFAGRFLGLVLKNEINIGILLDPVFFLQLSGAELCYTDVEMTDAQKYKSYRDILDMDGKEFDLLDGLMLTFPEDENVAVNSMNRNKYVDLMFTKDYVTQKQVESFQRGFSDMLLEGVTAATFFSMLKLNELDQLLQGSEEKSIQVEEWKNFTIYHGYEGTDDSILWFWMAVRDLSSEERWNLLKFWSGIHRLPRAGFLGLPRLFRISKSLDPPTFFPTSNTCFFMLNLPVYESLVVTREKISYISRGYVCASFGGL